MMTVSEHISQIVPLTLDEKQRIDDVFALRTFSKGDLWIRAGSVCNQVGFVQGGKLRVYYYDDIGNEVTCSFITPEQVVTSFTSFLTNTPSMENIAAIEDTQLLIASKDDLELLSDQIPSMQVWRRIVAENLFIVMERRIQMLQSQSANERYERMLEEHPEIILSVPLQYTASFLGMTPQHLSRLRKESTKALVR